MLGARIKRRVKFLAFLATRLVPRSPELDQCSSRFGSGVLAIGVVVIVKLY
jgi:hypothetical protein